MKSCVMQLEKQNSGIAMAGRYITMLHSIYPYIPFSQCAGNIPLSSFSTFLCILYTTTEYPLWHSVFLPQRGTANVLLLNIVQTHTSRWNKGEENVSEKCEMEMIHKKNM